MRLDGVRIAVILFNRIVILEVHDLLQKMLPTVLIDRAQKIVVPLQKPPRISLHMEKLAAHASLNTIVAVLTKGVALQFYGDRLAAARVLDIFELSTA